MSTYRVEWDCCGSVTETEAWEPESCPFCTDPPKTPMEAAASELLEALKDLTTAQNLNSYGMALHNARAAIAKAEEQK